MIHATEYTVKAARCPRCKEIHLVIMDRGKLAASAPLTREEWSELMGQYVDLIQAEQKEK